MPLIDESDGMSPIRRAIESVQSYIDGQKATKEDFEKLKGLLENIESDVEGAMEDEEMPEEAKAETEIQKKRPSLIIAIAKKKPKPEEE